VEAVITVNTQLKLKKKKRALPTCGSVPVELVGRGVVYF